MSDNLGESENSGFDYDINEVPHLNRASVCWNSSILCSLLRLWVISWFVTPGICFQKTYFKTLKKPKCIFKKSEQIGHSKSKQNLDPDPPVLSVLLLPFQRHATFGELLGNLSEPCFLHIQHKDRNKSKRTLSWDQDNHQGYLSCHRLAK